MNRENLHFIIIDNNTLNCFIAEKMLTKIDAAMHVRTFLSAQEALTYLTELPNDSGNNKYIILLDIHMPLMDGFEFATALEKEMPAEKLKHFSVYMLTSSTDMNNKLRSMDFPFIKSFLGKPLTFNILDTIISEV